MLMLSPTLRSTTTTRLSRSVPRSSSLVSICLPPFVTISADHRSADVPSTEPTLTVEEAIAKAETLFNGKYNEWPATLEFVAKEGGSLALTHVVQIQNEETGSWVEAFIDAHTGEAVHVTDFVAKSSVSDHLITVDAIIYAYTGIIYSTTFFLSLRKSLPRASRLLLTPRTRHPLPMAGTVTVPPQPRLPRKLQDVMIRYSLTAHLLLVETMS